MSSDKQIDISEYELALASLDLNVPDEKAVATSLKVGRLELASSVAPVQRQNAGRLANRVVKVYDPKTGEVTRHISGLEATKRLNEGLGIAFDVQPDVKRDVFICEHASCGKPFRCNKRKGGGSRRHEERFCAEHRLDLCHSCGKKLSNRLFAKAKRAGMKERCVLCGPSLLVGAETGLSRTSAFLAAKKACGERIGEIPFGYRVGQDGKRLEPDQNEQSIIANVHELSDKGLSVRRIADELATCGVVGRSGNPLSKTQVHRLLSAQSADSVSA